MRKFLRFALLMFPVFAGADPVDWPVEKKVGQLLMVHDQEITPETTRQFGIGAILVGPQNSHRTGFKLPADWRTFYARFGVSWPEITSGTMSDPPVLFGVDAVHGHALVPGATVFPHNIGLAAAHDPALCGEIGVATAAEVVATGLNWVFSPVVAVTPDPRWGRTYEGWGETWEARAGSVAAYIHGIQDSRPGGRAVLACAKHFIADGQPTWGTGVDGGIDQGDVRLDEAELRRIHLPAYREAVEAGVASIMVSYGSWKGLELHHHAYLLKTVLRDELDFKGVVVSDFNGFVEKGQDAGERAVSAMNSGVDLLMVSKNWERIRTALIAAVRDGSLPESRLNEALARVLAMKQRLVPEGPMAPADALDKEFGGKSHRAIARRAAREVTTLLADPGGLLPLKVSANILVSGSKADHAGAQCGGWTVNWGGLWDSRDPRLRATTLLEGLREHSNGKVEYFPDGIIPPETAARADICVVVVGEWPTAEWRGDNPAPSISEEDRQVLERVLVLGRPVLAVVLSGRPLDLGPDANRVGAWVAAWLPGSEGEGVADALFGDQPLPGRSSMRWNLPGQSTDRPGKTPPD